MLLFRAVFTTWLMLCQLLQSSTIKPVNPMS
jgi:hypothetical protein